MEYARSRLMVSLILSYKISTHIEKKGKPSPKEKKSQRNNKKTNSRERLKADRGEIT